MWFLALLSASFCLGLYKLGQPFLETNEFRQTQTALSAWMFIRDGYDLFDYQTPLFGAPWKIPMEFPLYQYTAALVAQLGLLDLDSSLRLVSLVYFYLSALALYELVALVFGSLPTARLSTILYAWMPFCIQSARLCLIDYASVFFALCYILLFYRFCRRDASPLVYCAALVLGSLAYLVKITTMAAFAAPVFGYFVYSYLFEIYLTPAGTLSAALQKRWHEQRAQTLAAFSLLIAPIAIGYAWVHYSDAVKLASPLTERFTSSAFHTWNFGTLEQRLTPENWLRIVNRIRYWMSPKFALFLPILALVRLKYYPRDAQLLVIAACFGCAFPILVFFNLYVIHDYYLIAISPLIAILMGVGLQQILQFLQPAERYSTKWILQAAAILVVAVAFFSAREYPLRTLAKDARSHWAYQVGKEVQRVSSPEEDIIIWQGSWNPALTYYSKRRSIIVGSTDSELNVQNVVVPDQLLVDHFKQHRYQLLVGKEIPEEFLQTLPPTKLVSTVGEYSIYRISS